MNLLFVWFRKRNQRVILCSVKSVIVPVVALLSLYMSHQELCHPLHSHGHKQIYMHGHQHAHTHAHTCMHARSHTHAHARTHIPNHHVYSSGTHWSQMGRVDNSPQVSLRFPPAPLGPTETHLCSQLVPPYAPASGQGRWAGSEVFMRNRGGGAIVGVYER